MFVLFLKVAYILYPPNGMPWYPCGSSEMHHMMKRHGDEDHQEQVVVGWLHFFVLYYIFSCEKGM